MNLINYLLGTKPPAVDPYPDIPKNATLDDLARAIGLHANAKQGDSITIGRSRDGAYAMITSPNDRGRPQILTADKLGPQFKEAMERLRPPSTERTPLRGYVTSGTYRPVAEETSSSASSTLRPLYWNSVKNEWTNEPPTPSTPSIIPVTAKTAGIAAGLVIAAGAITKAAPSLLSSFAAKKASGVIVPEQPSTGETAPTHDLGLLFGDPIDQIPFRQAPSPAPASTNTSSGSSTPVLTNKGSTPPFNEYSALKNCGGGSVPPLASRTSTTPSSIPQTSNNPLSLPIVQALTTSVTNEVWNALNAQPSLFTDSRNALWAAEMGNATDNFICKLDVPTIVSKLPETIHPSKAKNFLNNVTRSLTPSKYVKAGFALMVLAYAIHTKKLSLAPITSRLAQIKAKLSRSLTPKEWTDVEINLWLVQNRGGLFLKAWNNESGATQRKIRAHLQGNTDDCYFGPRENFELKPE